MDTIESWLKSGATMVGQIQGVEHIVSLLFQELQRRSKEIDSGVDQQRLAKLEWACLDLLDGHPASPVALHEWLRAEPEFFVEVLGLVFRPKNGATDDHKEISEEEGRRAGYAYRLLMSWHDVPGSRDGQSVDEGAMLDWVRKARSLAEKRCLLESCDSRIGFVLAYAPAEADGSWPCIPVRDVLEEIGMESERIFGGFRDGIRNKRGSYWKSLREGGAPRTGTREKVSGLCGGQ